MPTRFFQNEGPAGAPGGDPGRETGQLGAFALALVPILAAALVPVLFGPFAAAPGLHLAAFAVAGAAWLFALGLAGRGRGRLGLVWAGALVLRLIALAADPQLSDDQQRYLFEGALVLDGKSPYAAAPADPEREAERERWAPVAAAVNHPEVPAAYPPGAQALFALAVGLAGGREALATEEGARRGLFAVRLVFTACDLLVLALLGALLRRRGRPPALAVAWGWSPLVLLAYPASGHFDSAGIALLLAALWMWSGAGREGPRGPRAVFGAVLLGLGAAEKFLRLVALGGLARAGRGAVFLAGAALGALVALHLPLLLFDGGLRGLGAGLGQYAAVWESTPLLYRFVEPALEHFGERDGSWSDPRRLGRAAVGALWLLAMALLWRARVRPVEAAAAGLTLFLLLSPTVHPWYLTWIVPFAALLRARTLAWLAAAGPLLYAPVGAWQTRGLWEEPTWLFPLFLGPLLLLGIWDWIAHRARGADPHAE